MSDSQTFLENIKGIFSDTLKDKNYLTADTKSKILDEVNCFLNGDFKNTSKNARRLLTESFEKAFGKNGKSVSQTKILNFAKNVYNNMDDMNWDNDNDSYVSDSDDCPFDEDDVLIDIVERARSESPLIAERLRTQSPILERLAELRNSPLNRSMRNSPFYKSMRNSPVNRSMRNSPVNRSMRNSPINRSMRNSPINRSMRNSPSEKERIMEIIRSESPLHESPIRNGESPFRSMRMKKSQSEEEKERIMEIIKSESPLNDNYENKSYCQKLKEARSASRIEKENEKMMTPSPLKERENEMYEVLHNVVFPEKSSPLKERENEMYEVLHNAVFPEKATSLKKLEMIIGNIPTICKLCGSSEIHHNKKFKVYICFNCGNQNTTEGVEGVEGVEGDGDEDTKLEALLKDETPIQTLEIPREKTSPPQKFQEYVVNSGDFKDKTLQNKLKQLIYLFNDATMDSQKFMYSVNYKELMFEYWNSLSDEDQSKYIEPKTSEEPTLQKPKTSEEPTLPESNKSTETNKSLSGQTLSTPSSRERRLSST